MCVWADVRYAIVAEELLQLSASLLPNYEMSELSSAVLGIFEDPAWLLYGGASEDAEAEADEAGHVMMAGANEPPPTLLGLEAPSPPHPQHYAHDTDTPALPPPAAPSSVQGPSGAKEILPIEEHREVLMASVRANQVTCIQGGTGCGKSSMVCKGSWFRV